MITKSDSREVQSVAISLQSLGKLLEEDIERELLRAGADAVVIVSHRIKHEGKDSMGVILDTKSMSPSGRYSQRWASARKKEGLQTARVDLYFTGDMMTSLHLTEMEKRSVGVGFITEESDEKAGYLEEYYGNEIFVPSEEEEEDIMDDAMLRFEQLIDKL